jgi:hypothetical protein
VLASSVYIWAYPLHRDWLDQGLGTPDLRPDPVPEAEIRERCGGDTPSATLLAHSPLRHLAQISFVPGSTSGPVNL